MNAEDKLKKADKGLKAAMLLCLFMGVIFLGFTLRTFLKHQLLTDTEYNKPVPFEAYRSLLHGLRAVTYWVFPCIGIGYLVVGYAIWDYRRKR
ncbi:MAG TPA: hypothetical protein VGN23_07570 [Verrucomicrobiae bacterium]|jgi:heme/copper-type cytochrome/quinol oxidase subunit 1